MMYMNILILISDRSYSLWLLRGAEAHNGKGIVHPTTGRGGPKASGYFKGPDIVDVWHYKGGRSSAIGTGSLYLRRNPYYSFSGSESSPGHLVPYGDTEKIP